MTITVRREVLVQVPTLGKLWKLGDLRAMLQHEAVADLDDDWVLILQEGDHGHSVRFLEPHTDMGDRRRLAAVERLVNGGWTLETHIDVMQLPVRTFNLLSREGLTTVEAIIAKSENDLLDIRNFGLKDIAVIKDFLTSAGFSLRPNDPDIT